MANYTAPSFESVLESLTGRKGLRTAKPKDGFSAYVWRMARFHCGIDPRLPMLAQFDIANWADHSCKDGDSEKFKALCDVANEMADKVCVHFGLDKYATARRWHRAFYG